MDINELFYKSYPSDKPQAMSLLDYFNPKRYIDPYNTYSNPFKRTQQVQQVAAQPSSAVATQPSPTVVPEANKGSSFNFNMSNLADYIPNIFGQSAPSYLPGLLGAEETKKLQDRANIQGLLGAGLALAQGMSRIGPRRSAAENILGAIAGGFGAAGGAYEQGVKNYMTQQQLAQAQLAQSQAVNKFRSIAEAKAKYPDLAPLFDIDPAEATKQAMNRERAKLYGFGSPTAQPGQNALTSPSTPMQSDQAAQGQQVPTGQPQGTQPQLIDPAALDEANLNRRRAAFAISQGDLQTAKFFQDEADRLDPKETFMFRDGKMVSTKRGLVGDFGPDVDKKSLVENLPNQFTNVYPTLAPRVKSLISRAPNMTRDQIVSETQNILEADSKILAELDPKLRALEIEKRKSGKTDVNVYTGQLSKTTAGQVEQGALTDAAAITRLNNIQFSYKPEYQNIKFRTAQAWNTLRDKFGALPDTEKRQLADYSQYRQNALQNLNQTIKDITGAAMGVQEAERIIASLPNAGTDIFGGDSPTEFEAKLNNAVKQTKYALARKNYALKKGLNWENTPLDTMPSIINKRGSEIAKSYNLDPKKPADLQTIQRQLAAEFGISF